MPLPVPPVVAVRRSPRWFHPRQSSPEGRLATGVGSVRPGGGGQGPGEECLVVPGGRCTVAQVDSEVKRAEGGAPWRSSRHGALRWHFAHADST